MGALTASSAATIQAAEAPSHIAEQTVEEQVRGYFQDIPELAEIARCESTFRHYSGEQVLRGKVNRYDVGVMQINTLYHGETAEKLGLDLTDFGDNLAYARYLYEKEGVQPWSASKACWKPKLAAK